jgi:transcriptional regulator with PAS, ATPase and Fis domain
MATDGADLQASDELRARLKWFLLGRVGVISGFLVMVAIASLRAGHDPFDVPLDELLPIVMVVYALSALSAIVLPHLRQPAAFAYAQIAIDVLLVTGVISLTGGPDSPFAFLYTLPIINAAVLLFDGGALFAAVCAALTYDALLAAMTGNGAALAQPELHDPNIGMRVASTNLTFGLIAFLSSILTRRLHAAERLLREKQAERDHFALLQGTLARAIGSGLITTDPDGRISAIDATAEQLVGQAQAEVIGQDIGAIFPPLRLTPAARLSFLQSSAASQPVEFVRRGPDDVECHLRCVGAPLASTFGHPIGALYVLQNVTALKELAMPPAEELEDLRFEVDAAEIAEAADGLYGISPAMGRLRALITRIAGSEATVLVGGESGTGKEVVARAIHARSPRRDKRFIAINCGAIPEHLIESELFGHVRGAFTGAIADRPGCFRAADGGTLFLDEIAELPSHLQVKLLRVLQERTFRPVGSETNVAVDTRIIAASNRNLPAKVKDGSFREDLFYRLNVIAIDLPPLRDRREDIPILLRHFLRQFSELHGRQVTGFSAGAGRLLLQHSYPGNIRELENVVEHVVALCDGDLADEEHLPPYLLGETAKPIAAETRARCVGMLDAVPSRAPYFTRPPADDFDARMTGDVGSAATSAVSVSPPAAGGTVDLDRDLAEYEKAILLRALDQAGGVKKRAAELLGINYRSLRHRLQKYGLADASDDPSVVQ